MYGEKYFVLIQFDILPSKKVKDNLQIAGVELDEFLPGNAYLASIKKDFNFTEANQSGIIAINILPAVYKISKQLLNYTPLNNKEDGLIAVSFFKNVNKAVVENELKKIGAILVVTKYNLVNTIFIEADKKHLETIAALPFITNINLQVITDKTLNYNSRAAHGISGLNALAGKNLNGKNVTAGLGDNADISTHIDFTNRLILRTPAAPAVHGTHTGGTLAGAGIANVQYHGMAPKATIINQYFSDIITNAPTYITDNNMVVSNNSYYSGLNNCPGEGVYDVLSNYADAQLYQYKQLIHVVAAGNDGALTCSTFPASFGTVKSGWQCAKNVLTVGAINSQNYSIGSFSSRGPVADGRIKPEITASGVSVISSYPYNSYGFGTGTSMASPVVTGSLVLLYERYRQLNGGANPINALMKALICNTAEDLGNVGPDYTFGFGMLNARRAVEAIEKNSYFVDVINNGGTNSKTITVPANTKRLKVMLYWADTAAAVSAATTLVNDLDITVQTPAAVTHYPLVLNANPMHVNDVAAEGADHTNNIEQVVIENPVAGNYAINVSGFAVPFGPQQYVVSYEIIQPSVTLEYPYGGETFVPGETEIIRWNGYGNETNTFTIDSSIDNGVSWGTINNNVPATSMDYSWIVPPITSNTMLIRVSRNGTALFGVSHTAFTILGQPALTATNVCAGAEQLDWSAISGATSYDILQINADSMKVIGNTITNTFLLQGLNKNTTTWLGVAAKNGATSGRRSVSVQVLPNSGACSLLAFNNDLTVDSILTPNTARQHFANQSNATAPVSVVIKNLGGLDVTAPYTVSFSIGGTIITENSNTPIVAGGSINYIFTGAYPVIATGYNYNFKAWVTFSADGNHLNDTAFKNVQFINNDAITTLPLSEGFEAMADTAFINLGMGIGNNKYLDFNANTSSGRARTFVNTGFAYSGKRSLTLDQWPANTTTTVDSITLNYNLVNYTADQLRLDFYYNNHGQANNPNNKIWIRGSENNAWVQAYDLFINQAALGQWKHAVININDVLNAVSPIQNITQTFQIKIGEEGNTSANDPNPISDIDDGYTFDDFSLKQAINDVALLKINSPDKTGCGLVANNALGISIKNFSNSQLNNINVSYQVNGGAITTEILPVIGANQNIDYTFTHTTDLSAFIDYTINFWINYPGDTYSDNDSILNYTFHNSPAINTYPYLQNFEKDNGKFFTNGTNDSWQWGTPAKTIINKAPNGNKAWVTNLTGNYNDNETSYLYTPCFNLSSLIHPMLSFSHIYNLELNYDFTWVEYSTDGIIWKKLGTAGSGTNWYDDATLNTWNAPKNIWHVASIELPASLNNIRFRFVMSSDAGVTMEGVGIDDVSVFEKSDVAISPAVTIINIDSVKGNNWIPFNAGNQASGPWYVLAEINPNGQDLGKVSIELYSNTTGAVRFTNNQYYLDRNIVIHPANPPAGNVGVRLYFTDKEANALIAANACPACSKPTDAYGLGVTKYSGTMAEENGTLDDDISGFFQYFTPVSTLKIPHSNGYYAEFSVNSFSEFWFNNGGANYVKPLPVNLLSFEANKQAATALLYWQTSNEINTAKFILERSGDTRTFNPITTIFANGTIAGSQYNFTDALPLPGINYYRLKIISRDGTFTYSSLRKLNFDSNDDNVLIYPNPVINKTIFISASANCLSAILYDAAGKLVKSFALQGRNNTISSAEIAKGIYQLKVISENATYTQKILVQ